MSAFSNRDPFSEALGEQRVLSGQFAPGPSADPEVEGELRLCLAVLEDAVDTFKKYAAAKDTRGRRFFHEAEEWLMHPETGAALSFEYVGETLGFDVAAVRARLERWRRGHLTGDGLPQRSGVADVGDQAQYARRAGPTRCDGADDADDLQQSACGYMGRK
jgi:hypothetical protein